MRDPHTTGNGVSAWIEAHQDGAALSPDPSAYDFVARQGIYDQMGHTYGYELLFRPGWHNQFTGHSDAATRFIARNSVAHGFEGLTEKLPAFVNCTREALVGGWVSLLPRAGTVLELVETLEADEEVLNACRRLKHLGYSIALHHFQFSRRNEGLIELADYVKIDFRFPEIQRRHTLRQLEGSDAKLIAERIETEEELRVGFKEGFALFQGSFLEAPRVFSRRKWTDLGDDPALLKTTVAFWPEVCRQGDGELRYLHPASI